MLCIAVLIIERGINASGLSFSSTTSLRITCYTLPVVEMAHSSNVIIHGGTFNSAQGSFHINNDSDKDLGMHDLRSVQKSILIDDPMKDFVT